MILIKDDIAVADASGTLLEAEGYRVVAATSTTQARAVLQREVGEFIHPPDSEQVAGRRPAPEYRSINSLASAITGKVAALQWLIAASSVAAGARLPGVLLHRNSGP